MSSLYRAPQRRNVQSFHVPLAIEAYMGILNNHQSNLNEATRMKMEALGKIADLPVFSQEDMDSVYGFARKELEGKLDSDFVSPFKMAKSIMDVNSKIIPGIHSLKSKAEAVATYDNMRLKWGPNAWMGEDPRNIGIKDESGNWRTPESFKVYGVDSGDIAKNFLEGQAFELTKNKRPPSIISGTGDNGIPYGMVRIDSREGISDTKRKELYFPGSENAKRIAQEQLVNYPELVNLLGNEEAAINKLMDFNWETSGKFMEKVTHSFSGSPKEKENEGPHTPNTKRSDPDRITVSTSNSFDKKARTNYNFLINARKLSDFEGNEEDVVLNTEKESKIKASNRNVLTGPLNLSQTSKEVSVPNKERYTERFNELKDSYPGLWETSGENESKFLENLGKLLKGSELKSMTVFQFNDEHVIAGATQRLDQLRNDLVVQVEGSRGTKEISEIRGENIKVVGITERGDFVAMSKGTRYIVPATDADNVSTGLFPAPLVDRITALSKVSDGVGTWREPTKSTFNLNPFDSEEIEVKNGDTIETITAKPLYQVRTYGISEEGVANNYIKKLYITKDARLIERDSEEDILSYGQFISEQAGYIEAFLLSRGINLTQKQNTENIRAIINTP